MRVRQTVLLGLKHSTCTEEKKKNIRNYAIGINSTNKFRNWLGLQLLYFATKIDAKNSLETRAMWHNNQGNGNFDILNVFTWDLCISHSTDRLVSNVK
jgi:hypothetical protein